MRKPFLRRIGPLLWASALLFAAQQASAKNRDAFIETSTHVRIHVIDAGVDGAKPALVLVPGWSFTAAAWTNQIDRFSKDRRVVAIDPRSQGESTKTAEGDTPEQRARDLHEVLEKLNLKSIVLVGWSQGVQDVAAYAGQFGTDRLRGVVLVDAAVSSGAANIASAPQAAVEEFQRFAIYTDNQRAYLGGMMQAIISRKLSADELNRLIDAAMKTPPAIGLAMLISDFFSVDRTPALAKIDRPTLVIAAESSSELAEQKAMAAKLAKGRFTTIADAAHAVFIDQPERFNTLLAQFLDSLG